MQQLTTTSRLIKWCDEKVKNGHDLLIRWDGGGDSGWVELLVDGQSCSEPEAEALADLMDQKLDYGSWAGEFHSIGEAEYNPETHSFEGIDNYGESRDGYQQTDIEIVIPKELWFNDLNIFIEQDNGGGDANVTAQFGVKNGFLTPEHEECLRKIEYLITEKTREAVDEFEQSNNEMDRIWNTYTFSSLSNYTKDENGDIVYSIDNIGITYEDSTEKHVILSLTETEENEEN